MITYTNTDLFTSKAEAWVNPVNCVGVSGAGLALEFRNRFPENQSEYVLACARRKYAPGHAVLFNTGKKKPKFILNVATKNHWKNPSRLNWVKNGIHSIWCVVNEHGIKSVAMPALGCGNGGLKWEEVKPLIESVFGTLKDVKVIVYLPR